MSETRPVFPIHLPVFVALLVLLCASAFGQTGGNGTNYSQSFAAQTSVTIAGTSHNLNTANLIVACYDNASPANEIFPANKTVNGSSFDVIVTFAVAQTGSCTVNGSGPSLYTASLSSNTTWSISAATHNLGTHPILGALIDSAGNKVDPASYSHDSSGNVTITVAVAQAYTVELTN